MRGLRAYNTLVEAVDILHRSSQKVLKPFAKCHETGR